MQKTFESAIVQKGRLLPGIHGLRGIAALAVVLFHLKHIVGIAPTDFFEFIGRDFGFSVHLFFIVSAFSLCHSTEPMLNRPNWLQDYFIKRFFRIAPLFYFMILLELVRQIFMAGRIMKDLDVILLNFTFTFGFVPFSDFVWGGWSVGVEMIFYVIFPVLLLALRSQQSVLVFLIISTIVCSLIRTKLETHNIFLHSKFRWSDMAFASNFCFFVMGLYAYRVSHFCKSSIRTQKFIPVIALIIIGGLLFFNGGYFFSIVELG